jgi:hypothetical protein
MNISEKFIEGIKNFKNLWMLPLAMLFIDLSNLLIYQWLFKTPYSPNYNLFTFKVGVIDTPPTIRYLFEDFPNMIFNYSSKYGLTGIVDSLSLFNILLILSNCLILSFVTAGYLSCIEKAKFQEKIFIRYFFVKGNELWFKFFILSLLNSLPIVLFFLEDSLLFFTFLLVIFYYVKFSIVVDGGALRKNFSNGLNFFVNNIGLSIKMAIYCGFVFIFVSIPVFYLGTLGFLGILAAMIIVYYFGMAMNIMVLEVYRESRNKEQEVLK